MISATRSLHFLLRNERPRVLIAFARWTDGQGAHVGAAELEQLVAAMEARVRGEFPVTGVIDRLAELRASTFVTEFLKTEGHMDPLPRDRRIDVGDHVDHLFFGIRGGA